LSELCDEEALGGSPPSAVARCSDAEAGGSPRTSCWSTSCSGQREEEAVTRRRLAKLEWEKLFKENEELLARMKYLQVAKDDAAEVDSIIKSELKAIKKEVTHLSQSKMKVGKGFRGPCFSAEVCFKGPLTCLSTAKLEVL
jgi:hypothetical protein